MFPYPVPPIEENVLDEGKLLKPWDTKKVQLLKQFLFLHPCRLCSMAFLQNILTYKFIHKLFFIIIISLTPVASAFIPTKVL